MSERRQNLPKSPPNAESLPVINLCSDEDTKVLNGDEKGRAYPGTVTTEPIELILQDPHDLPRVWGILEGLLVARNFEAVSLALQLLHDLMGEEGAAILIDQVQEHMRAQEGCLLDFYRK